MNREAEKSFSITLLHYVKMINFTAQINYKFYTEMHCYVTIMASYSHVKTIFSKTGEGLAASKHSTFIS